MDNDNLVISISKEKLELIVSGLKFLDAEFGFEHKDFNEPWECEFIRELEERIEVVGDEKITEEKITEEEFSAIRQWFFGCDTSMYISCGARLPDSEFQILMKLERIVNNTK